jgi:hypothetical protein
LAKKPFETSLLIMTFPRRQVGDIFNIIREIRGLMAGFFALQIPEQQFRIGFLVLSIVTWIGPKRRRGAMTRPPRDIRVDPSQVVNTGRIRRDINRGPNSMFPECPGANDDITVFELRDGNFPLRGSDGNTITAKRRLIAQPHSLAAEWLRCVDVLRRGHADALEFPHPDADFGNAAVRS